MEFWLNRRVLITGHTGFKGSWLAVWLKELGAEVCGYSLAPPTDPSMFELCGIENRLESRIGNIKDLARIEAYVAEIQPEIIFHLAAQSLVRASYAEPAETFATNVMGTVHILEAARKTPSVRAVVNVTSDKCYENRKNVRPHTEEDPMGGNDPYSASKGCAELISMAYARKMFPSLASVRAGNVIGGGDWAADRLVPDCVRDLSRNLCVKVRNPLSVRPWQHVLDPLGGYLALAENLFNDGAKWAGGWNFGPDSRKAINVADVVEMVTELWGGGLWEAVHEPKAVPEAEFLALDITKAKRLLDWQPRLSLPQALEWTISWYSQALSGSEPEALYALTADQIRAYEKLTVLA